MPRLSEVIQFKAMRSGLEITCNANPKHVSKLYYEVLIDAPQAVFMPDPTDPEPVSKVFPRPQLQMRICPNCMVEFMTDAHKAIQDMAALQ